MKKALMIWGGWDGHTPKQSTEVFEPVLRGHGFDVLVSDTLDALLDAEKMKDLDLIVMCVTMSTITGDQENALVKAVASGVGLAGWHGGMCDSFRQNTQYQFLTGGQWVAHPGGCIDYMVNVCKPGDPIMKDIKDFTVANSEQYYMHVDPSNEVLATTTFPGDKEGVDWIKGCVMPVVWKRRWGQGRVFYTSLGHICKDFENPSAKLIVERGMLWAAK